MNPITVSFLFRLCEENKRNEIFCYYWPQDISLRGSYFDSLKVSIKIYKILLRDFSFSFFFVCVKLLWREIGEREIGRLFLSNLSIDRVRILFSESCNSGNKNNTWHIRLVLLRARVYSDPNNDLDNDIFFCSSASEISNKFLVVI